MYKLVEIAFKNIFRNKRRTIITEISIIIGIIVLIFVSGVLRDMEVGWRDDLIYSDIGHIQVMAKGLKENENLQHTIKDSPRIINLLKSYNNIKGISERIDASGLISNGENTQMFIGYGIEPKSHLAMLTSAEGKLKAGRYIEPDEFEGAVIGEGLAKKLKVKIGDILTLAANDKYESLNAVNIKVVGFISVGDSFSNDHLVLLHLKNARILFNFEADEVSRIVIIINKTDNALQLRGELQKKFMSSDEVEVFSWHNLSGMLNSVFAMMSSFNIFLIIILLVLTLISIMNTILMSVFERTKEIGTLMAIGSSSNQVVAIFILESFFIGIIGVILGVIMGICINFLTIGLGGLHLPPPPGQTKGIILFPRILPGKIAIVSVLVLLTSIIGSVYPARHAAKQRPVEALRSN